MGLKDLVRRFKAAGGNVRTLPVRRLPSLLIHGRKYVLSDYWPMMDMGEPTEGGAKLIDTGGNRWRYLWVFDTDRKTLVMWRVSDGDEKVHERMSGINPDIVVLDKKGQLNRVTHEEFVVVEREMSRRQEEAVRQLKELAAEIATDLEKEAYKVLEKHYEQNVKPQIERGLENVERGAIPFGFKVNPAILEYRSAKDQAQMFVVLQALGKFTQEEAYRIVSKAVGFDAYEPPEGGDNQAVQWAYNDLIEKIYDEFT